MASTPPDDITDLSDLTPEQRYRLLVPAADLAARGLYQNVVLSAYDAFHHRRADRFVREMCDAVRSGKGAIRGPLDDQDRLEAVLLAGDDLEPGRRLEPADVDQRLRPRHPEHPGHSGYTEHPGQNPRQGRFADYLAERLAERGGQPPSDPKHWMQMYARADALRAILRDGSFADVRGSTTAPPDLSEGVGRRALAVQRSKAALDRERTTRKLAASQAQQMWHDVPGLWAAAGASSTLSAGLAVGGGTAPSGAVGAFALIFLVGSITESVKALRETGRRNRSDRHIGQLTDEVAEHTRDFHRALGPVWPTRQTGGRNR